MTDNFIHKHQAEKLLGITEPELMTLVSNGRLKGFNQNRQPIKHYGRYHAGQAEDDRLPGAVLSTRVSYFDKGDIVAFADQNHIKVEELFPILNLPLLKAYAKRWAAELPGIRSIKLYPYRSYLAKEFDRQSSAKYAVVFDGKTEQLWDAITDDQGTYPKLLDARFIDIYKVKPDSNYRNDWFFTTTEQADGNEFSSIMTDEKPVDLWPDTPESGGAALGKENMPVISKEQAEEVIKTITVIRVSDTEIIIKQGSNEIQASYDDMGFKSDAKPWEVFMDIMQEKNHQYFVGRYDKINPDNNKDYRKKVKRLDNFSKNFIQFVNDKFPLSLPDVNVFQNKKHHDRAGIYEPKFQVCEYQASNRQVEIKSLSKEDTFEKLATLLKQHKLEKDKSAQDRLNNEISDLAAHAKKNNWEMPEKLTKAFFSAVDDEISNSDAMGIASYIDEVTKKDRYQL